MPSDALRPEGRDRRVPSMLDLVRLSRRPLFPPGGIDLYRQIALLSGMGEGDEVLDVACGRGVSLEYFVREFGVQGSGVDVDPRLVEEAEERARGEGLAGSLQFQAAPADALPYRDEIFDVSVGEIGLAAESDPSGAVSELVRVTRPGGYVVLVQLVWKAAVDEDRQRILAEHLGARPLLLVDWKRRLRAHGIEELRTEDWSDTETAFRSREVKPFPDFAEIFSLPEKIGILRRAWRRWGWTGVRTVLEREREIHRLLNRERILGLDLLTGRKPAEPEGAPADEDVAVDEAGEEPAAAAPEGGAPAGGGENAGEGDSETAGLPLFGEERTDS
jgi:SAM-dependent methyltransferase